MRLHYKKIKMFWFIQWVLLSFEKRKLCCRTRYFIFPAQLRLATNMSRLTQNLSRWRLPNWLTCTPCPKSRGWIPVGNYRIRSRIIYRKVQIALFKWRGPHYLLRYVIRYVEFVIRRSRMNGFEFELPSGTLVRHARLPVYSRYVYYSIGAFG